MMMAEGSVQTKLNQGHAALWEHDWAEAVKAYKDALSLSPDHPVGLASLGLALFHQNEFVTSLEIFKQLMARFPEDPMPRERVARIFEREGKLPEAVRSFLQAAELHLKARDVERSLADYHIAIRLDPRNQDARARIAMILTKLGRKSEAVDEFIDLAAVMQREKEVAKARQILEYCAQLSPGSPKLIAAFTALDQSQLIPIIETQEDINAAVQMAKVHELETVWQSPTMQTGTDPLTEARILALEELAEILFEEKGINPATDATLRTDQGNFRGRKNQKEAPDPKMMQLHVRSVIDLLSAGEDGKAVTALEKAIQSGLNLAGADYLFGLLHEEDDPQNAIKHLQRSVIHSDYALASNLLLGKITVALGQLKEAASYNLHALMLADSQTVEPEHAEEIIQLYDPIFESQSMIQSEKDLRNLSSAIHSQLTRPDWRTYLKAARLQLPPQPPEAPPVPLAEMLLDTSSNQIVESLAEIRRLAQKGKYRTAMEEAYWALTFAPTYLPLHVQMAEILINEGRISDAIEKFLLIARLYTIRGNSSQALSLLSRVTRLAPMDIKVRKKLIELLRNEGRLDEMVQQYIDLANVHYMLADLDEARKTYNTALNLSRQTRSTRDLSITILQRLADIELQSLNWKEAIGIFEQLRGQLPLDPGPRSMLVDLYFRLGLIPAGLNEADAYIKILESEDQLPQAEKFLDDLLEERPDSPDLQKLMTSYYIAHGKTSTAIAKLDALAENLLVGKNISASVSVVGQIIALNPPNRQEYEQLYQELNKR